jgi:hypothetical protein
MNNQQEMNLKDKHIFTIILGVILIFTFLVIINHFTNFGNILKSVGLNTINFIFILFGLLIMSFSVIQYKMGKSLYANPGIAIFITNRDVYDPWMYRNKNPLSFWIVLGIYILFALIFLIIGFFI